MKSWWIGGDGLASGAGEGMVVVEADPEMLALVEAKASDDDSGSICIVDSMCKSRWASGGGAG